MKTKKYDVAIIGGGVIGTGILYTLSKYTDIENIALIEKEKELAQGVSHKTNNSQTLHFGDIETNYDVEKSRKVKQDADLVKNYVHRHEDEDLYSKDHKMVLAVGKDEVERLEERYEKYKELFPELKKYNKEQIAEIEPRLVEGRDEDTELLALVSPDGYRMNFGKIAESFAKYAQEAGKNVDIYLNTKIKKINKKDGGGYILENEGKKIEADVVAVCTGGYSLNFAYQLGYGKELIILPVEGSFFKAKNMVNGKVYMMQDPKLPFAAIHADADVENVKETRFGPVSRVLPMLEKGNLKSVKDFFDIFEFRLDAVLSLFNILLDWTYFRYVLMQLIYDIPFLGKYFYLREARKIIPNIRYSDLKMAKDIGGIRPQIVNVEKKGLELGEAKITGENIIFNITPSPGASVCLGNARKDVKQITEFLGKNFDEERFKEDLADS